MLPGSAASEGEAGRAARPLGTPRACPPPAPRGPPQVSGARGRALLAALGSGPGRGRRALRGALARGEDPPGEGADPGTGAPAAGRRRAVSPRGRAPPEPCPAPAVRAPGRPRVPEPNPRVPTRETVLAAPCQQATLTTAPPSGGCQTCRQPLQPTSPPPPCRASFPMF